MKAPTTLGRLLAAALGLLVCGGCLAVAAGAAAAYGYVQYTENEALRDFDAGLDETWNATIDALQELDYPVSDSYSHGPTEGQIDLDEPDVEVNVERHPEGFTRVRVRIGTFETADHRRRAELLLNEVAERL